MLTFVQLLEQGYTIEEAVAILDGYPTSTLPTSNFANQDLADAKRDQEDWWNQ